MLRTVQHLKDWRASLGAEAKDVAVVVGTFHILHPGNLAAIRAAKKCSRHVCVILEGDACGSNECDRPVISLAERAEMVAGLKDIDVVASFSPRDAAKCIASLKPFLLVSCKKQVDGPLAARAVVLADARVVIPTIPGCFTPDILRAIRDGKTPILLPKCYSRTRRTSGVNPRRGRLVTVNGCFDVLHIGHLRFLAEAATLGDRLVVLVNNDDSVRRYKGSTRPVFPLAFRRSALMALKPVSDVRPFAADNPLRLLEGLKPAVHVKGGSYEPERVKDERKLLRQWGGLVAFCQMVEGRSTSNYLRKVSDSQDDCP